MNELMCLIALVTFNFIAVANGQGPSPSPPTSQPTSFLTPAVTQPTGLPTPFPSIPPNALQAPRVWGSFLASRLSHAMYELNLDYYNTAMEDLYNVINEAGMTIGPLTDEITPYYLSTIDIFFTSHLTQDKYLEEGELGFTQTEIIALEDWVVNEGGILICSPSGDWHTKSFEALLEPFGIGQTGFLNVNTPMAQIPNAVQLMVNPNFTDHPLTKGFDDAIEPAFFDYVFSTENPAAKSLILMDTTNSSSVSVADISPALDGRTTGIALLEDYGPGHGTVLVTADFDVWDRFLWHPSFRPFVDNLMEYLNELPREGLAPAPSLTHWPTHMPTASPTLNSPAVMTSMWSMFSLLLVHVVVLFMTC